MNPTHREIVETLATKLMDWRISKPSSADGPLYVDPRDGKGPICICGMSYCRSWNPVASLDTCRECEEKIPEDRKHEYVRELRGVCSPHSSNWSPEAVGRCILATAEQRCRAMYEMYR